MLIGCCLRSDLMPDSCIVVRTRRGSVRGRSRTMPRDGSTYCGTSRTSQSRGYSVRSLTGWSLRRSLGWLLGWLPGVRCPLFVPYSPAFLLSFSLSPPPRRNLPTNLLLPTAQPFLGPRQRQARDFQRGLPGGECYPGPAQEARGVRR